MRLTLVAAGSSPGEAGCDFPVRVGTAVLASSRQDRPAGRGCLGETDRLRDRRLDHVELISLRDGFQHRSSMQSATSYNVGSTPHTWSDLLVKRRTSWTVSRS